MARVTLEELHRLAVDALVAAGTSPQNARAVAEALVAADADGIASHGVARVPAYADQAASGKVDGHASPVVTRPSAGVVCVDAANGFAFPAIRAGLERAVEHVSDTGLVAVSVTRSHHFGAGGYHVEWLAQQGFLALGFGNSPAGIAPWGGSRGTFGTNPIAFACPRQDAPALVIDLSLSKVARGRIMVAAQKGEAIPDDWALDASGRPTTDPKAGLQGTMIPIGEAKGAALAFMVEILAAALTGANPAFQASSFFDAEGPPPGVGQLFVVLDSQAFTGSGFLDRVETLIGAVLEQEGTRLPGSRRLARREASRRDGVEIPQALHEELRRRAAVS